MAFNPLKLTKLLSAKKQFESRHPRVVAFIERDLLTEIPEGTVLEMTIKKPGQPPATTNMKVCMEDKALLEELKALK